MVPVGAEVVRMPLLAGVVGNIMGVVAVEVYKACAAGRKATGYSSARIVATKIIPNNSVIRTAQMKSTL
jgi:hypothetical protein